MKRQDRAQNVVKKIGKWRIVNLRYNGFIIQRWKQHWFKGQWRNVEFLHGCMDMWMDYFPTYDDAKETLAKISHVMWR